MHFNHLKKIYKLALKNDKKLIYFFDKTLILNFKK